jgi:uncharacterized OB-fold protein
MSDTPIPAKPSPSPSDATAPFWAACAEGRLRLRACTACGARFTPTRAACGCGCTRLEWVEASGRGTVFSYTVVHRAPDPAFRAELPYVIAIVALEDGGRLMSNVIGCAADAVRIGLPVRAVYETVGEGVGVPKFTPA